MAWTVSGNIKGPAGDDGVSPTITVNSTTTGAAGSSAAVTNSGTSTAVALDFVVPRGDKGDPGAGIEIAGSVATYGDLPTGLGTGDAGKAYFVAADGDLYIWDGAAFPADGSGTTFQGPAGTAATIAVGTVTTGAAGSSASVTNAGTSSAASFNFTIPRGDKGDTGDTGTAGTAGTNGSKWFNGSGAPGSVGGSVPGDYYLDVASGDVYVLS
ncbi:hypothetical protein [Rhodanobacter lindaniclasticus]